ncbi:MAG: bifunctional diguanylate cyclase/phosphodiesterase [Hyphomicrobiaceae bacterium]
MTSAGAVAPQSPSKPLDFGSILTSVRETVFRWDLVNDQITWAPNAAEILGIADANSLGCGQAFQCRIAGEQARSRQQAILEAASGKTSGSRFYNIQYHLKTNGAGERKNLWIEENGSWVDERDGRPVEIAGVLRVHDDGRADVQQRIKLAERDELTGLMNRTRLNDVIEAVIGKAKSSGRASTFLLVAVDNLALTNDTFGFGVGDEVIAQVARRLADNLRSSDTLGRYSTNKFGIAIEDCTAIEMRSIATRLLEVVRHPVIETSICRIAATVSIVGLELPKDAQSAHDTLALSLETLASTAGRQSGMFLACTPNPKRASQRRRNIAMVDQVMSALDQDRMRIALQPIVRTDTLETAMFECLLRMEQPDGSVVAAGEFMPLAGQLGLSQIVDRRVVELAVAQAKANPDVRLTINISSLTAASHEWLTALEELTGGNRAITNRLVVEITETETIHDLNETINFVDTLKEIGCQVAIDDFGAGYTSFQNLRYLGVDMVKIDGSFVESMVGDPDNHVFVQKLSELAHHFGIETVAEWVGDQATADILKEVGITYLQGFYFGMPKLETRTSE